VSNDRLACQVYALAKTSVALVRGVLPVSRIIAFDANGGNIKMLSTVNNEYSLGYNLNGGAIIDWLPDEASGAVLMTRTYVPDEHSGMGSTDKGLGVDRIDTRTLKVTQVERPKETAVGYITDGHGAVRIMANGAAKSSARATGEITYMYRMPDSRDWKTLGIYHATNRSGFRPLAVDRDMNVAYGLKKLDGRLAIYSVKLDGSLHEELVYARPDLDVDNVVRFSRQQHVVGVGYSTDMPQVHWLDPKIEQLLSALHKVLPQRMLRISEASLDENVLLLWAGDPRRS
jgi:hypothetical protein